MPKISDLSQKIVRPLRPSPLKFDEIPSEERLFNVLRLLSGRHSERHNDRMFHPLERSSPQSVVPPMSQEDLDRELLFLFLDNKGGFDNNKMRNLLSRGASPSVRAEARSDTKRAEIHTALQLALTDWALEHQFQRDTALYDRCKNLKRFAKEEPAPREAVTRSREDTYEYLFGEKPELDDRQPENKVIAIKKILVDCAQLLASPEGCIPLFEMIEEELEKEWVKNHGSEIPLLEEKNYTIQCHDRTLYPIPTEDYDKNCFSKKNSILQKTVYRMMCETGLVTRPAQKWIQAIPKKISMEYLRQNVFFVEDRASPTGLLHGKISHNLQRLLICLAIRENIINMEVGDFHITMEELFGALMDSEYTNKKTNSLLWQKFFDWRNFSEITFSDPHRLHSFLMTSEKRHQFRLLSDCMIHSFCNGLVKISKVLNELHREKVWNPKNVWEDILSCMQTELFFDFKPNLTYQKRRGYTLPVISKGEKYLILEKEYRQKSELEIINENLQRTSVNLPDNVVEIIHEYHGTPAVSKQGMFARKKVINEDPTYLKSLSINS